MDTIASQIKTNSSQFAENAAHMARLVTQLREHVERARFQPAI